MRFYRTGVGLQYVCHDNENTFSVGKMKTSTMRDCRRDIYTLTYMYIAYNIRGLLKSQDG